MKNADKIRYSQIYRDGLLNDTLDFWFPHCVDTKDGGFFTALHRDGSIIDTDKSVWHQGRISWLLATLYNTVEQRPEWLAWSKSGIDFLRRHAFDHDGRMYFQLTRDGRPLRKRRYIFSEAFAAIAFCAYAVASGDEKVGEEGQAIFQQLLKYATTPGMLASKTIEATRPTKSLALPMILINTAQELRATVGCPKACSEEIDRCIAEIRDNFLCPEWECVLETVGADGRFLDHFDGRTLNPGHAIEAAWFILHEARLRGGDKHLIALGCQMLDWMWLRGWDNIHGGILYFVDARGLPVQEYWHDMKFWWPHTEAIIATLLAYHLTGNEKYAEWHRQVHEWAYAHFPDPDYGEWYGYLHRDGRVSVRLKGNLWKGNYHFRNNRASKNG